MRPAREPQFLLRKQVRWCKDAVGRFCSTDNIVNAQKSLHHTLTLQKRKRKEIMKSVDDAQQKVPSPQVTCRPDSDLGTLLFSSMHFTSFLFAVFWLQQLLLEEGSFLAPTTAEVAGSSLSAGASDAEDLHLSVEFAPFHFHSAVQCRCPTQAQGPPPPSS